MRLIGIAPDASDIAGWIIDATTDLLPVHRGSYGIVFERVLDGVHIVEDSSKRYNLCIPWYADCDSLSSRPADLLHCTWQATNSHV
jgi:hypothetical protein